MTFTKSTHEILILGSHHGGLTVAHYLLRHVVPKMETLNPSTTYHVTLVGPNTDFFWNLAAPRHLVSEQLVPAKAIFLDIATAFKSYNQANFRLVIGKATDLSPETKVVTISLNNNETEHISYNSLVIATGASYASPLWQVNESESITKAAFETTRSELAKAKTVLIAGGGAVGVETAGEIGTTFPNTKITLLSGSDRLLPRLLPSNSVAAANKLLKLHTTTEHKVRVTSSEKNADGTYKIVLDNGETRTYDVYVDATGGKPNSAFLPKSWLNEKGYVNVDPLTLRATFPSGEGIYAIGDVASYSDGSAVAVGNGVAPLGTSIALDLAKAVRKEKEAGFKQKQYKGMKDTQFVPTGPSGGVGQLFGWKLPSFFVWLAKSRTFFVQMAPGAVNGSAAAKP